jgi:hypothetical protein
LVLTEQSDQLEKGWQAAEEQDPGDGPGETSDVSAMGQSSNLEMIQMYLVASGERSQSILHSAERNNHGSFNATYS